MIDIHYPDYDINEQDDDTLRTIKEAIARLRPVERKIFLTYVEGGTYTSVAKEYNVSVPTARNYVLQIKNKITNKIKNNNNVDDNNKSDLD